MKTENKFILDNLYQHQKRSIEKGREINWLADFSECGTGKTLVQIELMLERDKWPVLVICPKSIMEPVWQRQLTAIPFTNGKLIHSILAAGGTAGTKKLLEIDWTERYENLKTVFIINYDLVYKLLPDLLQIPWAAIVLDESTAIKNPQAKRSKAVLKLSDIPEYRSIMTGTPAPNGLLDFFNQIMFLHSGIFGRSYYAFRTKYFERQNDLQYSFKNGRMYITFTFGREIVEEIKKHKTFFYNSRENAWCSKFLADDLNEYTSRLVDRLRMIPCEIYTPKDGSFEKIKERIYPYSIAHKKRDCIDLPPLVEEERHVEMSKEQARAYKQMRDELLVELEGETVVAPFAITKLSKLRQLASGFIYSENKTYVIGNEKLDALLALLDELGESQIIIFCYFRESGIQIKNFLIKNSIKSDLVLGGIKDQDRQQILEDFRNGKLRVLVAGVATLAHGHNFDFCSNLGYFELDFSLESYLQSKQRIERIGQKNKMTVFYLLTKNTLETWILQKLRDKVDLNKKLDVNELRENI